MRRWLYGLLCLAAGLKNPYVWMVIIVVRVMLLLPSYDSAQVLAESITYYLTSMHVKFRR